ncbi:hypothetical protein G7Y89_g13088 [Cudoniella acicularis]|uniref:Apple domain-containing protein n=1 Tax=Cudoniella acicularis TaxID=354080 RepID=A0A8H4R972_9HELO|nr:hypothetical protein G7Y89_g13088 [Cudoniella acicularis]
MLFSTSTTTTILSTLLLTSTVFASPLTTITSRDQDDDSNQDIAIFPSANKYDAWAICKTKITKQKFPKLAAPTNDGGCVRYFQGIDMTGVVTQVNLYKKDGINSACDCAAACLDRPLTCTNWVFKHTFAGATVDQNARSCTLYSSPNLPTGVTLKYDTGASTGFNLLLPSSNPQAGGDAPLTFLDMANTQVDKYGVSGFVTRDTNGNQYC